MSSAAIHYGFSYIREIRREKPEFAAMAGKKVSFSGAAKRPPRMEEEEPTPPFGGGASESEDHEAERRRRAILDFMRSRNLKAKAWARRAKLSEAIVLNFLNRHSRSLTQRSLERLAAAENVTIAELIGEIVPSEVPGKELVAVAYISVEHAKGGGAAVVVKRSRQTLYFKPSFLDRITRGKPNARLGALEIESDAMEPSLSKGDTVLIDLDETNVAKVPGIYCFWDGHELSIKRLSAAPGSKHMIRIQSDNTLYPTDLIAADEVQIIGRVIWRSGAV